MGLAWEGVMGLAKELGLFLKEPLEAFKPAELARAGSSMIKSVFCPDHVFTNVAMSRIG